MTWTRQQHNAANRAYYARNKEVVKARVRAYRLQNIDTVRAQRSAYVTERLQKPEYKALHNSVNKAYYWDHKEKILARIRARRQFQKLL